MVAHCVTGSIYYPQNISYVEWHIIPRSGPSYTQSRYPVTFRPLNLQPNISYMTVATFRENATRKHNGMQIACRLYFEQKLKVESNLQNITVYCMTIVFMEIIPRGYFTFSAWKILLKFDNIFSFCGKFLFGSVVVFVS